MVLEMKPDRLAVFSYAHVPWIKPAQKILEQQSICPPPEIKLELLKLVIERLTADNHTSISAWTILRGPTTSWPWRSARSSSSGIFRATARAPGRTSTRSACRAISQIPEAYWQNEKELPEYQAALDAGRRAAAARLFPDRRGQNPPRNDHARDVRPLAGLRRDVAKARDQLRGTLCAGTRLAGAVGSRRSGAAARRPDWKSPTPAACSSATSRCALTTPSRPRANGNIRRRFEKGKSCAKYGTPLKFGTAF